MKQREPRTVHRSFSVTPRDTRYSTPRSPVRQKNQSPYGAEAHLSLALREVWVNKRTASPLPLWGLPAKPVLGTAILWLASMIDGMWGGALEPDWAMRWHGCLPCFYLKVESLVVKQLWFSTLGAPVDETSKNDNSAQEGPSQQLIHECHPVSTRYFYNKGRLLAIVCISGV